MAKIPKTTKRAMILPSFQGYFEPPHCNANRRQTMAGMNSVVPIGSNCFARSQKPIEFSSFRGGEVKNSAMPKIVTAPIGRLM